MSRFSPEFEELVDLFCDGKMSAEQAGRLEALVGESDEWRQYLLESFQVHCELAWEFRRAARLRGNRPHAARFQVPAIRNVNDDPPGRMPRWRLPCSSSRWG